MSKLYQIFFLVTIVLLTSCGDNKVDENLINELPVELNYKRFEKDLFTASDSSSSINVTELNNKYRAFFNLYAHQILNIPEGDDSSLASNLKLFVSDPEILEVYSTLDSVYSNTSELEAQLLYFLKHYNYYYPQKPVPSVVTFMSAFNYAVIATDSTIGIGLDMFLGADYPFYPRMGIPKYMFDKFSSSYIIPSVVKGWYQSDYSQDDLPKEFLSHMIYQGKMLYYIDKMIPEVSDTLKTGYSNEQLNWCINNESRIWSFFIEKKLLFSTDQSEYAKFINEGPSSHGFPKEAPARIGSWVGWQIVKKYMDENSDVSFTQLMDEKDALMILEKSGYKPQR